MVQTVMIVDKNREHAPALERHLAEQFGLRCYYVHSGEAALRYLMENRVSPPNLILFDISEGDQALDVIRSMHLFQQGLEIIALATHAEIERAVEASKMGATDFLLMPFHPGQLTVAVRNALLRRELQQETLRLHGLSGIDVQLKELHEDVKSQALHATLFVAEKIAESDSHVVLEGSPGCGRELFAQAIHNSSVRKDAPFYSINLALYSPLHVESTLFGSSTHKGILERVGSGTLFFRNISSLSDTCRTQLAQIAAGEVPIHPERPDVYFTGRMMFAMDDASRRLALQEKKEIRQFFSQVNAMPVTIPSLKDMKEDIPFLATLCCKRFAPMEGKAIFRIHPEVLEMLQEMSWPGNIQQLSVAIFHAVMCCAGTELQMEDFRYLMRPQSASVSFLRPQASEGENGKVVQFNSYTPAATPGVQHVFSGILSCMDDTGNVKRLQDMEQELIRYALQRYNGHMSEVARHLGIGRSTLYRKLSSIEAK